MSPAFVLGYILGGITFIPLLVAIVYIISFISKSFKKINSRHKYNLYEQGLENDTNSIKHQLHKAGWLQVYKNSIGNSNPTPTIGGIVASYISGSDNGKNNNIYYLVLKYNTIYLYDSEKQLDCKEVIVLNDYKVSIYPLGLPDAELFCKAQHIKLKSKTQTYYINCNRCIDKEDWYFILMRASKAPLPGIDSELDATHFEQVSMNHLINIVHSNEYHFQTQWLNALLGRVFLSIYRTQNTKDALYKKIVSKLDKINAKRPQFLGEITVRSVAPGRSIPHFTQPKLIGISPSGDLSAEANLHYDGCFRIEIETVLEWRYSDLLPPFTINIVLAITLEKLEGKILVKLKEHPTNRIWYAFEEKPLMKWKVEPVIWEKRVGYSVVVKAIETKLQEFITETMVLPNFDDIVFFPTGSGGIFQENDLVTEA
ncbi:putative integral membrane protein conserved region-domain-containing protein, partial [Sporodiniella umbellata]